MNLQAKFFSSDLRGKYELKCLTVLIKFTYCFLHSNCITLCIHLSPTLPSAAEELWSVIAHVREPVWWRSLLFVVREPPQARQVSFRLSCCSDGLPAVIRDARESHINPHCPTHLQITCTSTADSQRAFRSSPTGETKTDNHPLKPMNSNQDSGCWFYFRSGL